MSSVVEFNVPSYAATWNPAEPWYDNQLADHAGGYGVLAQYGGQEFVNHEALSFMYDQIKLRTKITPCDDLLTWAWDFAFQAIDQVDPYVLFYGATDVIQTDEPYYYQFSIREDLNEGFLEVDADNLEMFRYHPEGQNSFDILMGKPGLQSYFTAIYDYYEDYFSFIVADSHPEAYQRELKLFDKYGPIINDLGHCAIWAAIMWMISPEARSWRANHHPIFNMCYEEGSCLLREWRFYSPDYFRMDRRKAKSCASCGIDHYCVQIVQVSKDSDSNFLCESCSTKEPFPGMTCGRLKCSLTSCQNHPLSKASPLEQNQAKRMLAADKRYGHMMQLPNGIMVRELPGMIHIDHKIQQKYARSIADDMGRVLQQLLGPSE